MHAAAGIWRTVWMEPVPAAHLTRLSLVPDIDTSTLSITAHGSAAAAAGCVTATAFDMAGFAVARGAGSIGQPFVLRIPRAQLWSPESPYLYDLTVALQPHGSSPNCTSPPLADALGGAPAPSGPVAQAARVAPMRRMLADSNPDHGTTVQLAQGDVVRSYFGMRKVSLGHDAAGSVRLRLNNKPIFMIGMLDQARRLAIAVLLCMCLDILNNCMSASFCIGTIHLEIKWACYREVGNSYHQ